MNIVGGGGAELVSGVQTIDVWFSQRRQAWIIERIDAEGNQVGSAHVCEEADIAGCVADWLRAHDTVQFVTPHGPVGGHPAMHSRHAPRRRAA